MSEYTKLVKALRCKRDDCDGCDIAFFDKDEGWMCQYAAKDDDAAAAIEELQSILTEADKKQAYQHDYICELVAEKEELQAETERLKAQLPKRGQYVHGRELSREYIGDCLVSIDYEDWRCSVCGIVFEQWSIPKYNYCPNCGAKMGVPDGDEKGT